MIVRSLAALLIVFAVGCASEKALNRGCAASSVRVSAVVFEKAFYNAASQAELIEKFRSHDVEPLWSHVLTPGGGAISTWREARVFSGYEYVSSMNRPSLIRREVMPSDNPVADHPVKQKKFTSRDVGERIEIGETKGDVLGVECEFSFVEESKSDDDFDIVHSGKVMGTVPVGAGDRVIGSVQADASGSQIIVIIISQ